jgi:hypothetical protein
MMIQMNSINRIKRQVMQNIRTKIVGQEKSPYRGLQAGWGRRKEIICSLLRGPIILRRLELTPGYLQRS